MKPHQPLEILLVEDSPTDVLLAREALEGARMVSRLHTVPDGEEAIKFVRKLGSFSGVPRPDLILLDLNLPKKDGREVLADLKNDPGLRRIPVVVLTTSSNEMDIFKAYDLHANCYIVKPVDFEMFAKVVASIEHFWFEIVTRHAE